MKKREVIIKEGHRGLWYEDGVFKRVVEAGRHELEPWWAPFGLDRRPMVDLTVVDVRQRELTIKGQEILTSDKVAIRVSIIVQFRVTDPARALHEVASYEERLYTDVQLAARRSLASTSLEEILTNRNRLSEDILSDVKETAAAYGVAILRSDVKDLIFPGNLQEIMNKVLAAERMSQVQLVDARTKAEVARIEGEAKAVNQRRESETLAAARLKAAEAEAGEQRIKTEADLATSREREKAAAAFEAHPSLLRLRELDALSALAKGGAVKLYVGFEGGGKIRADKDD